MYNFLIPFHSLADTLQRLIFYKAAILSNKQSILLFEDPEAHTYPPYITNVVQSILDSTDNLKENQYQSKEEELQKMAK